MVKSEDTFIPPQVNERELAIEDLAFLSNKKNDKSISYAIECIDKLDKIEQIVKKYDGTAPSMIKQFSEMQKILEQDKAMAEYEIVPLKWKSSSDAEVLGTAELNVEPDGVYMSINKETYEKIRTMLERSEQEPKTDSTNIPDGATNGDVIKAMFNPYKIFENTYSTHVYTTEEEFRDCDYQMICHTPWWNAPYKESEGE